MIRDYTRPIFKAAGLKSGNIRIHLVKDNSFNAFVVDSKRMFINTGTIIEADTPNEIIGVLAHETGHIVGGHMIRLREAMKRAQTIAAIGMLAGAGANGSRGSSRYPQDAARAGTAIMTSAPGIAQRTFLSYARTEENPQPIGQPCAIWNKPANRPKACCAPSSALRTSHSFPVNMSIPTSSPIPCPASA